MQFRFSRARWASGRYRISVQPLRSGVVQGIVKIGMMEPGKNRFDRIARIFEKLGRDGSPGLPPPFPSGRAEGMLSSTMGCTELDGCLREYGEATDRLRALLQKLSEAAFSPEVKLFQAIWKQVIQAQQECAKARAALNESVARHRGA